MGTRKGIPTCGTRNIDYQASVIIAFVIFTPVVCGFINTDVAPREYGECDQILVLAADMTSVRTQLPYEYYSLPFCAPTTKHFQGAGLDDKLTWNMRVNTPYQFHTYEDVPCGVVCSEHELSIADQRTLYERVIQDYNVHMLVDNLAVLTPFFLLDGSAQFDLGYRLGVVKSNLVLLHNHLDFTIRFHQDENRFRIVGFEVEPKSLAYTELIARAPISYSSACKKLDPLDSCTRLNDVTNTEPYILSEKPTGPVRVNFTYSLTWVPSSVVWNYRWKKYLQNSGAEIHWFSIINSLIVVLFLTAMLAMKVRHILKQINSTLSNGEEELSSIKEKLRQRDWRVIGNDVFRPPRFHMLLSALVGTGVHLFGVTTLLIGVTLLGYVVPAIRGAVLTIGVLIYLLLGAVAGYSAGRLFKTLKGQVWRSAALLTSLLWPAVVFGVVFFTNCLLWANGSSAALPLVTLIGILATWFVVSVPLCFLGFYHGYRKKSYCHPVEMNTVPRHVPKQPAYMSTIPLSLIVGLLPFGAMFIELFFILGAWWQGQFYSSFGCLFLVYVLMLIINSQISVICVYFRIAKEDYHWWWTPFVVSGGSAFYMMAYSIFYIIKRLNLTGLTSILLYFSYSILMSLSVCILAGSIGFYTSYMFIKKIYTWVPVPTETSKTEPVTQCEVDGATLQTDKQFDTIYSPTV